jgi:glycosyltransferase involved in cell wall biosynthesis
MPSVTVILPCRNEVDFIDRCLASVLAQEGAGDFEVLVVDGRSDDGTRERLAAWDDGDPRVTVIDNPERIVPTALNLGIRASAAPVIVRMDVHSRYPSDYLARCLATLEATGADNVGGVLITHARGDGFAARLVQAVSTHRFGVGASNFRVGGRSGPVDTVPFGCFPREVFARLGGFDERLVRNQDFEFNARIRAAGGTVWLDPAIRLEYFNQPTVTGLYRQAVRTGRWNVWTWVLAPYAFRRRHAVPMLFAAFVLVFGGAALLWTPIRPPVLGVAALYLALALVAAVQQGLRMRAPGVAALLPLAFTGYHLAYGFGSLGGLGLLLLGRAPFAGSRSGPPGPPPTPDREAERS